MEWLSVRQVCEELQVSRLIVLAMIRDGELAAVQQTHGRGRPWFVERAALEAWLDGQRSATARFVEEHPSGNAAMWDSETGIRSKS